jgi:RNA polymerase sigma factor (TIGR02999 family)
MQPSPARRANDALFEQVYARLKALAGSRFRLASGSTLQTTALVHELYLRMQSSAEQTFEDPKAYFSYAARAMRHILTDRARHSLRQRAAGSWVKVPLSAIDEELMLESAEQALALDQSLQKLEAADARAALVLELLYFAGLTLEQAADVLGVTRRTIDRDWQFARLFLQTELS